MAILSRMANHLISSGDYSIIGTAAVRHQCMNPIQVAKILTHLKRSLKTINLNKYGTWITRAY